MPLRCAGAGVAGASAAADRAPAARKRTETKTGRSDFFGTARSCRWRGKPGNLILAWNQIVRKYAFEPALFVLVVQQDHGSNPQRMAARVASRHFPLQVLQETIGEMILVGGASRRFYTALTAVRTSVFQSVLLRIAAARPSPYNGSQQPLSKEDA